ncbi:hypothetical protein J2Y55_003971 [Bosea sp. BE125]|uniref:type II toxin-antitoxin system VapB family antitoxin n=1 Tax=Bosea sp. BE125 TaxID=2817909 RepID=UPI0028643CEB|nr:type II toxin-antitoxin system VapB family antitoxin [Bosea sp. BE125]MDR6872947.1 hypothetical protein [Bosea sp. BE125]
MGILIRDAQIDRDVRELAEQDGSTLQGAIGLAVRLELERRAERRKLVFAAAEKARARLAKFDLKGDGLSHKQFFDREYGDA